jgi:hypothetical protein
VATAARVVLEYSSRFKWPGPNFTAAAVGRRSTHRTNDAMARRLVGTAAGLLALLASLLALAVAWQRGVPNLHIHLLAVALVAACVLVAAIALDFLVRVLEIGASMLPATSSAERADAR